MSNNVEKVRKEKDISRRTLSDKTGLTELSLYRIEKGLCDTRVSNAILISRILNVSVEELFNE